MKLPIFAVFVTALVLAPGADVMAGRTGKGAAIGAGVGLLTGGGVKGTAKGALVGGGVGALTENNADQKKTKDYAGKGALVGAGVGLLTGDGAKGALKGAMYGGSAGALLGSRKKK